ncbi:MAG: hypothetical protein U0R69_07425 [Gaiellales bacterium]
MDLNELDLGGELFSRHARKDERTVVALRGIDRGEACVVEVEVFPANGLNHEPMPLGPYSFTSFDEAVRFTEEALLALEYLGCSVHSGPADDAVL